MDGLSPTLLIKCLIFHPKLLQLEACWRISGNFPAPKIRIYDVLVQLYLRKSTWRKWDNLKATSEGFECKFIQYWVTIMSSLSLMAVFLLLLQSRASSHSLVDTSTPKAKHVIKRLADGKNLKLVMSDEFEKDGRDFSKGSDPLFEALEKPDNTNEAMQYCKLLPEVV